MSLHLLNHLPTLTAFCRPIQTIHRFINTHPVARPRQPASFLSTVGQILPYHCCQSPVPPTKICQSVLPNSNQLVQTMPCQLQMFQSPSIHAVSPYSSISRPTPSSNRQLQSYLPACSQIPLSQQGPFPFTLMDNQGSSYSAESAHYSHPTSDEGISLSATAALSVPARPKPVHGLFMFGT